MIEKSFENRCEFLKADEHPDFTLVLGPALVPDAEDLQGDVISSAEIEKAAHNFMQDSQRPGLMHQLMLGSRDACVVESYIVRRSFKAGSRVIKRGTWMVGMRVFDTKLRKLIREGKLRGYSIGGSGEGKDEEIESEEQAT